MRTEVILHPSMVVVGVAGAGVEVVVVVASPRPQKLTRSKSQRKNRPSQKIMAKDRCTGHTILHPYPFF